MTTEVTLLQNGCTVINVEENILEVNALSGSVLEISDKVLSLVGVQGPPGATGPQGPQGPQGDIGPQGPPGAEGAGFNHTQSTPSELWTINHNLGYFPGVSLYTPGGLEMIGTTQHLNTNTLLVYLNTPSAGSARLS